MISEKKLERIEAIQAPVSRAVQTFLEVRAAHRKGKGAVEAGDVAAAGARAVEAAQKLTGERLQGLREEFSLQAATIASGPGWEVGETRRGKFLFVY